MANNINIDGRTRRFTVPPIGQPPLVVAYATEDPVRVMLRNEWSGGPEEDPPAPLHPFNQFAIGGLDSPLTLPIIRNIRAILSTDFTDLYSAPQRCFVLADGGQDIFVLAPRQYLYALSMHATFSTLISVNVITALVDEDAYMLDV